MLALLVAVVVALAAGPAHAQAAVERGKYLVEVVAACGNCHTPKGPQGDLPDRYLAGGLRFEESVGVAVAPNITPDRETGIGAWSDAEIVRAIREGKGRDGRTLGPPMPFDLYRRISDTDVKAMVAYLRAVPGIKQRVERSRYTTALPGSWGPPVGTVPDVPATDPVRRGEYLAGPIAHCTECHTPPGPDGRPDRTRLFAGGFRFKGPWGVSYSSNLTPDRETGIGAWSDAQIIAGIYGVNPGGRRLLPPMPWPHYAKGIADADLRAIIAYLRSLRPVRNVVPAAEPPGR